MSASTTSAAKPLPRSASRGVASRLSERALLWIILGGYFLLGIWYSLAVPAFETPDEVYHYAFARHLSQGNWLPVQSDVSTGPWQQEGSQAPLYYMLAGWLTAGVDQGDFEEIAIFNPRANMGNPLYPGNKNRMLYSSAERPLEGSNLALHMGRWLSLVMGGLTLWLTYGTAKLAFARRSRLPLMAVLLVATLPQFLFISASFSNDNMVVVAAAAVIFWLARILTRSATRPVPLWEWSVLGVLLGIAALSKLQALGLFALVAAVGLAVAWNQKSWRTLVYAAIGAAVPALLIAGWWYWRNYALYGDWTGVSHLTAINGLRQKPLDLDDFWLEFRGLRYSFWGLFGWFNILLPGWFYALMDLLSLFAIIGAFLGGIVAWRRRRGTLLRAATAQVKLLLLAWIALSVALLLYWMMRATGSQGRLIFPALGAIAVWFVIGLDFWFRHLKQPLRNIAWAFTPALLLAMSLYGVAIRIPAAYAAPDPLASVPTGTELAQIAYGEDDLLTLLAFQMPNRRYRPGDSVPVTLYLTTHRDLHRDYELFIQLLDDQGAVLGNITSHPGWGRNPTSLWEPGAIYADSYDVLVSGPVDPRSPVLARLYAGFIDPETQPDYNHPMNANDAQGSEITPILGEVTIAPHAAPAPEQYTLAPAKTVFGDAIEVTGIGLPASVGAGQVLTTTLLWEARAAPAADYTAFLHLLDSEANFVSGYDREPAAGRFPTSRWQEGDRILSQLPVAIPADLSPGVYEVWAGLYEADSQGQHRLPVTRAGESAVAHDMVMLGSLIVEKE